MNKIRIHTHTTSTEESQLFQFKIFVFGITLVKFFATQYKNLTEAVKFSIPLLT